jgi:ribonuclease PH
MSDGKKILDLDAAVDNVADVDLNVVMTGSGDIIEVQGTAEGEPFSRKDLDALIDLAADGIRSIIKTQKKILGSLE